MHITACITLTTNLCNNRRQATYCCKSNQ